MNFILLCTAFILQFVGHRIGDYVFQTDWQAQNKVSNLLARFKHCIVYSVSISALMLTGFGWKTVTAVFLITLIEHMWIDSRKPVIAWKNFLEKRIAGNKGFAIIDVPFFVIIEIDQTIHFTRILLISFLIGYGII